MLITYTYLASKLVKYGTINFDTMYLQMSFFIYLLCIQHLFVAIVTNCVCYGRGLPVLIIYLRKAGLTKYVISKTLHFFSKTN